MTSNVRMILDEVNARIKLAEAKTAEDPSNFDAFPGAENDQAVPAETKKPDPEVKEEGPASRTEVTGAEPGSDVPLQQDHLYEADEPVLNPEKKPADSSDAEAKEASANPNVEKVAADILKVIKDTINKKASCGAKCSEKTEKKEPEMKKEKKDASCGKCASKCSSKCASEKIDLGSKILDKIASVRMAKEAGANDAANLIKAAQEYNRGASDAQALIMKLAQALEDTANSAEESDAGATPELPAAEEAAPEAAGAADAEAAIADAAAAEGAEGAESTDKIPAEGDDQVTPEEVVEAVNELVDEGQISSEDAAALVSELGGDAGAETAAGEEPEVSEEELVDGITQAIENGDITEDEAQELVQELVDAGADDSIQEDVADAGEEAPEAPEAQEAELADAAAAGADEAAGAADAEAAIADAQKQAEAITKQAEESQIARYQKGFIQKCAEYGVDPQRVAQYIQARIAGN